jgi:DNA polymerase I-like protein with 3'-5' exonuclease and polymerase domains
VDKEVWGVDSEWGYRDGRIGWESCWQPVVFCAVGLHSGRRFHFLGRDPALREFIRGEAGSLFVCHAAAAEMAYLLRLGIDLPPRWYCTFTAYRVWSNSSDRHPAGLTEALEHFNLSHMVPGAKKALQKKIANLAFDRDDPDEIQGIINYCLMDSDSTLALYQALKDRVRVPPALWAHWMEYTACVARISLRGIPFDLDTWDQVVEHRQEILTAFKADANAICPIYRADGKEDKDKSGFLAWCRRERIRWPRMWSEARQFFYVSLKDSVLEEMETAHPLIFRLQQIRKSIRSLNTRKMAIDRVHRKHYYGLTPFRTITGRNATKECLFGGSKWLRFLAVPETPEHLLVNVDFVAQEVGIAAALSGDRNLRKVYEASDCHMAFAINSGAAPKGATKRTHPLVRKQYKTVGLGVMYGQTPYGMARRLGITEEQAGRIRADHMDLFDRLWCWSDASVRTAQATRRIRTRIGWPCRVPKGSNARSWLNWPMQSTGGDILRIVTVLLERQGVRMLIPLHDGFLLSCLRSQLSPLREAVDYACAEAVRRTLGDFPLRWSYSEPFGERYREEDGEAMWERVTGLLGDDRVVSLGTQGGYL